jgi:hypothetical protein
MGADGGIYYLNFTSETLNIKLLEMLNEWLCSDDCQYKFDGLIFVKDGQIMTVPDDETNDELATLVFTDEQLSFITKIRDAVVQHFDSNQCIPSDHSDNIMTWDQFYWNQKYDFDFDFREDFNDLLSLTREINDVWKAGFLWLYWDTDSCHHCEPFSGREGKTELKKIYDNCKNDDTFKQIFTDFKQFSSFVYTLPETDYIQTWT